ncbi:hypothetical protein NWF24_30890 [Variovorax paradoxus]|uniref:hypothetical protein n=1 Tax=Variovorax paradoxus TaxID=34073 RepID=UPI0021ABA94F|nr:hypothetical protein [Variovorax paradoxus]UVH57196.1 hypothetical protein NWF24_30890 [Variovorax paradoxus]
MTHADNLLITTVQMSGRKEFLVYDLSSGRLADDLTDYAIFLSRQEKLDEKTISTRLYHLKRFWAFVRLKNIRLEEEFDVRASPTCAVATRAMCDSLLTEFRDAEFRAVQHAARSKQKARTSMETVNTRLRAVYVWLCWLQQDERVPAGLIGPRGARVRSALPEHTKAAGRKDTRYKWSGVRQTDYPLLFRRTGKASKHKRVFVPSNDERLKVVEMMQADAALPFVAHRNVLIVDIASATGLRRASINSLLVEQFSQPALGEFVYVVPNHQKFGYEDGFAFPTWLYLRVQQYIRHYLLPMSKCRGWLAGQMHGRLFLSSRDGRPLEDRTLTQILGRYMRLALDAPPGAAVHAFRHRFINVAIMEEIRYRLAAGLDTSTDAITAAVGMKVGHKNLESIRPYVIYQQSVELARKEVVGASFE